MAILSSRVSIKAWWNSVLQTRDFFGIAPTTQLLDAVAMLLMP
ncbi:MAG: hypothetical protein ABI120_04120 [Gemmatimonadaceae bacterium]